MGDAAREVADRFHLLRLSQSLLRGRELRFRQLFARDVPASAINEAIFQNANPGNPTKATVLASITIDEAERGLPNQGEFEAVPRVLRIVGVEQLEDRHAGNVRLRPAQ